MTNSQNTGGVAGSPAHPRASVKPLPPWLRPPTALPLLARRVDRITALAAELGDVSVAIEADLTATRSSAALRVPDGSAATTCWSTTPHDAPRACSSEQRDDYRNVVEVNFTSSAPSPARGLLDQLKANGGVDIINISPSPDARPAPGTASTPPPNGAPTGDPGLDQGTSDGVTAARRAGRGSRGWRGAAAELPKKSARRADRSLAVVQQDHGQVVGVAKCLPLDVLTVPERTAIRCTAQSS